MVCIGQWEKTSAIAAASGFFWGGRRAALIKGGFGRVPTNHAKESVGQTANLMGAFCFSSIGRKSAGKNGGL